MVYPSDIDPSNPQGIQWHYQVPGAWDKEDKVRMQDATNDLLCMSYGVAAALGSYCRHVTPNAASNVVSGYRVVFSKRQLTTQ